MPELCYRYLRRRTEAGVLVLTITTAELRGEDICEALRQELRDVIADAKAPRVVLDLGEVTFITSMGLAALLSFRRRVLRQGGRLVLCAVAPLLLELLTATHLTGSDRASRYPFELAPDADAGLDRLR